MKAKQITFSDIEYGNRKRTTKREEFLDIAVMSQVDWRVVASASVLAGVLSLLTSVAGLPEVED